METRRLVYTLTGIGVALIVILGGLTLVLVAGGGGASFLRRLISFTTAKIAA